jgi:uncharacterized protein involved in outer membrane biogenesis
MRSVPPPAGIRLGRLLERALLSMGLRFQFGRSPGRIALASLTALALLFWAFDWTWVRPLIRYCVAERAGRSIDFDELRIGLNRALDPTVELRGLLIQNAPWASDRPLVRAGLLSFTFSWRTLLADQMVVNRLVLVDAEVDLERQADGLRNWRLIYPTIAVRSESRCSRWMQGAAKSVSYTAASG